MFGKGKQSYLKDLRALQANLKTRLMSFSNDCFFDTQSGIDWFNLIGSKDQDELLSSIRKIILETDGVTKINSLETYRDSSTRSFRIEYNIDTIYSTGVSAVQGII
jgi:hypothetical protein